MSRRTTASGVQQTLRWDSRNQLAQVSWGSPVQNEYYGYDEGGRRVARAAVQNGVTTVTYYPFAHYEQTGGSGAGVTNYYAFGATMRSTGTMPTDHLFTDQQQDASGLYYYGARYYDPAIGHFISPDTIVPDPANVMDYQRYMYTRGNPVKYNDPTGHYSVDELQQHFGVNSFDELMAIFGEGGQYEGNSGWYDILRAAQDGDQITAYLPNPTISISGSFMRNSEGRIQIDMGSGYVVPEAVFADFGGHHAGMTYNGRPAEYGLYFLQGARGHVASATSGTQAFSDTYTPCRTWDCTSLGYDVASLGTSAVQTGAVACTAVTGLICGGTALTLTGVDVAISGASMLHNASQYASGEASDLDIAIASGTTIMSAVPGVGIGTDLISLGWDLIDPFVPDEELWGPGRAY